MKICFFHAEDGIRDYKVTGVQTCALPISGWGLGWSLPDGLFLHEGSSGTLAWADPKTRVIGILFLQYRDQKETDVRLRSKFRQAVRDAFAKPQGESSSDES